MGGIIGVFDSGVGGLTVFRELKRELPQSKFIYLGDTARTPYGSKGPEIIKQYATECAKFLLSRGVSELVVACNTASSHALGELKDVCGAIPVFGTIAPAVESALRASRGGAVLVLGTKSTIRSNSFANALSVKKGLKIVQHACPLFVPLVEEGVTEGRIVDDAIDMYLRDFKDSNIDTVILGCTHYPLLRASLQRFFGDKVTLVDCASTLAASVKSYREKQSDGVVELNSADEFFVTDDPIGFAGLASKILDTATVKAEKVQKLVG